tara:strand:+ start:3977 stop:4915 length:939 start_codon:yes stop_codon:yes gene_type:complete
MSAKKRKAKQNITIQKIKKMSFKNTPITAKIKRTTQGGMVQQPLLNMGGPVKMKMSSPAKGRIGDALKQAAVTAIGGPVVGTMAAIGGALLKNYKESKKKTIKPVGENGPAGTPPKKGGGAVEKKGDLSMTPYSSKDGKGTIHGPKVSYDMAYKKASKTKQYAGMSKADYIKEAKRQTKSFKETGKWDAGGKSKTTAPRKKVEAVTTIKAQPIVQKKVEITSKLDPKEIKNQVAKVNTKKGEPSKRNVRKANRKATSAGRANDKAARARLKGQQALSSGNLSKARRMKRKETRLKEKAAKKSGQAQKAIQPK